MFQTAQEQFTKLNSNNYNLGIVEYKKTLSKYGLKSVFGTNNSKLKKDGIVSFKIPAFKSANGEIICNMAGGCEKECYALKGHFIYKNVKDNMEKLFSLTKDDCFVQVLNTELNLFDYPVIRIHDSGDFYNLDYLVKWIKIAYDNPCRVFYAYTKAHLLVDLAKSIIPSNLILIKSVGSKKDFIDYENDRHAKIFNTYAELVESGYELASVSDKVAYESKNNKIGLLLNFKPRLVRYSKQIADYHGKDWKTVHNELVIKSGSTRKLLEV